jgi:flagellar biosynthesis/type III secretory pathway protein FliH
MSDRILRAPAISPVGSVADALPASIRAAIDEAYQRGLAEGWERAQGELAQHSAVLARKITDADDRLVETVRAATRRDAVMLADLAIELAEWFVGVAVTHDADAVRAGIAALVGGIDEARAHTLHLHPDVVALLAETADGAPPLGVAAIEPDPSLAPGELRLTTNGATVERVWRHAVDRVREALVADITADIAAETGVPS